MINFIKNLFDRRNIVRLQHFILEGQPWRVLDGSVIRMKNRKEREMTKSSPKNMTGPIITMIWIINLVLVAVIVITLSSEAEASNHINYDIQLQQQLRSTEITRQNNLMRQQNEMMRRQNEVQRNIWIQQQQQQRSQIIPSPMYQTQPQVIFVQPQAIDNCESVPADPKEAVCATCSSLSQVWEIRKKRAVDRCKAERS